MPGATGTKGEIEVDRPGNDTAEFFFRQRVADIGRDHAEGDLFAGIEIDVVDEFFRQARDAFGEIKSFIGGLAANGGFFEGYSGGWSC